MVVIESILRESNIDDEQRTVLTTLRERIVFIIALAIPSLQALMAQIELADAVSTLEHIQKDFTAP